MAKKFDLSVVLKLIDKASAPLKKFGNNAKAAGKKMSIGMTVPLTLMGGLAIKSAIDIESAFAGVRKTVNASSEVLMKMKTDLERLSTEVPIPTAELMAVAEAAGQLGIQTKNIIAFTRTMADLGATTDISATDAASSLAQFANITGMSQGDFDRLGSVIVDLGNNMATTESKIVNMGMRLAGVGRSIGLTPAQIMSLSAALSSVGIKAEAGGTAFSQVMAKINKEVGSGSKAMDNFAIIAGKSTKEFEDAWKKDAAVALLDFVDGLKKADKAGLNVNLILDKLGFAGMRISDSLLRASGASDKFKLAQERGNVAWKENNALTKEAELRYKTTRSQMIMLKNSTVLMAASFGAVMIPVFRDVMKELKPLIDWFKALDADIKKYIVGIGLLVAVLGPLTIAFGVFAVALAAISLPMIAIGLGIAALVAIGWILFKNWDKITKEFSAAWDNLSSRFSETWGQIKTDLSAMDNWIQTTIQSIKDTVGGIGTWIATQISSAIDALPSWARKALGLNGSMNLKSSNQIDLNVSAGGGATVGVTGTRGDGNVSTNVRNGKTTTGMGGL